jgi:hypothetical protein
MYICILVTCVLNIYCELWHPGRVLMGLFQRSRFSKSSTHHPNNIMINISSICLGNNSLRRAFAWNVKSYNIVWVVSTLLLLIFMLSSATHTSHIFKFISKILNWLIYAIEEFKYQYQKLPDFGRFWVNPLGSGAHHWWVVLIFLFYVLVLWSHPW